MPLFVVKIDQFQKKNKELAMAAPGAYQPSLVDKRSEPKYSMGARIMLKDRRISASPDRYNIPSKILESPGKTMGAKLGSSIASVGRIRVPGPGTYAGEKYKVNDLKFSMGGKLKNAKPLAVPGPGTYDSNAMAIYESV